MKKPTPNNEYMIKAVIEQKKQAFAKYRDIQIKCLENTHVVNDGSMVHMYNVQEMNEKLASAEHEFYAACKYLEEIQKNKEEQ